MTPLSEQLAQLSAKAKSTEDNFARAQSEAHEKIERDRQQARENAQQAIDTLNRKVGVLQADASSRAQSVKAKLQADAQHLKQDMAQDRRAFSAWQKENYAEICEDDAALAIDYAATAISMAESAVLDAVDARKAAIVAEAAATPLVS